MSNCYILPSPEDNLESIFHSNYEIARIFSYGGGIGINISNLRPAGSRVHNVARTSTGAVSFMKIFNTTGEVISQNGAAARRWWDLTAAILIFMNSSISSKMKKSCPA